MQTLQRVAVLYTYSIGCAHFILHFSITDKILQIIDFFVIPSKPFKCFIPSRWNWLIERSAFRMWVRAPLYTVIIMKNITSAGSTCYCAICQLTSNGHNVFWEMAYKLRLYLDMYHKWSNLPLDSKSAVSDTFRPEYFLLPAYAIKF